MPDATTPPAHDRPPAISVGIPVHNAELYVAGAIDSLLRQTFPDFELLVVDDASTDGTAVILDAYARKDPRVRVIHRETCGGSPAARNMAIDAARAPLFASLDADDTALPHRLEKQKKYMDAHPEVGMVASPYIVVDVDGEEVGMRPLRWEPEELVRRMQKYCHIAHWAALFRTQALRNIGGYRTHFYAAEDYDLLLRFFEQHRVGVLDVPVCKYRQVPSSVTYAWGDAQKQSAALIRLFARQRAERGTDDYEEYARAGRMPKNRPGAKPVSKARYCHKLARTALDCGAYRAAVKYMCRGVGSNPLWLPPFAVLFVAGAARFVLQKAGLLDWFERTLHGR